jgi:hypothetical protein
VKIHKFKVGQMVRFGGMGRALSGPLDYKITSRMPENERGPQYRIKGSSEAYERSVAEVEISGIESFDD